MPFNSEYAVLLSPRGKVYACGQGMFGEFGAGSSFKLNRLTEIQCPEMTHISTGDMCTVGISSDGRLFGCGGGSFLSPGYQEAHEDQLLMTELPTTNKVTHVSTGVSVVVWAESDNSVWIKRTAIAQPTLMFEKLRVKQISTGNYYCLILDILGSVYSFGRNSDGQLGRESEYGPTNALKTPTQIESLSRIIEIASGRSHNLCLSSEGCLYGFGCNLFSQLCSKETNRPFKKPTPIEIDADIISIDCGGNFSIFYDSNGDVWVCGQNHCGQLCLGDCVTRHTPEISVALNGMKIIPGADHIFAIDPQGMVYVCGNDWCRELEDYADKSESPQGLSRLETGDNFVPPISRIKSAVTCTAKIINN